MSNVSALAELRTFGRGSNVLEHPVDVLGRARFRATIAPESVRVAASLDPNAPIPFGGTAVLFNSRTWIGSRDFGFWEQIAPQAVTKTLQEADVRLLQNHDPNLLLARTSPAMRAEGIATLRLASSTEGVKTEAEMAPTSYARDLAILLARRDCNQMSFAFDPISWDIEILDDGTRLVTITELRMFDVSIVTYPAYEETDAGLRAAAFDAICRQADLSPSAVLRGYLHGGEMPDPIDIDATHAALLSKRTAPAFATQRLTREQRAASVATYFEERALNGWTTSDAYTLLDDAVDDLCEQMDSRAWGYVYKLSDAWLVFVCYCAGEWCLMQVDYDIDPAGNVTLGTPAEVIEKTEFLPAPAEEASAEDTTETDAAMADAQMMSSTVALAARTLALRTAELEPLIPAAG